MIGGQAALARAGMYLCMPVCHILVCLSGFRYVMYILSILHIGGDSILDNLLLVSSVHILYYILL